MLNRERIVNEFNRIKSLGFIKSNRLHDTGIGKTFEDYLGVTENNLRNPDFDGFEVKSHRRFSISKVTLFTKSPTYPRRANSLIAERFGVYDDDFPDVKIIHSSFYGNNYNNYQQLYRFKLELNRSRSKLFLLARDVDNTQIDIEIYWSFDDLQFAFNNKLHSLFFVTAEQEHRNDGEYFHYTNATVMYNPVFDNFLQMIEDGEMMFDLRMGVYRSGRYIGRKHDHGSGFRFKQNDLPKLYETAINIDDDEH